MGTYVHRIHKSTLRTVHFNGEETTIAASKFAYKLGSPVGRFSRDSAAARRERAQDMTDTRVANAWDETNFPKLVAYGGYEDGYTVYEGFTHNHAIFYDNLTERMKVVGFVKKVGRSFTVVTEHVGPVKEVRTMKDGQWVKQTVRERRSVQDGQFSMSYMVLHEEPVLSVLSAVAA